jgi:3-mercaptopyruvate sulfurtransferase SseA
MRTLTVFLLLAWSGAAAAQAPAADSEPSLGRDPMGEFQRLLDESAILVVDVRGDDAYRAGHIPGAISVPLDALEKRVAELRDAGKPVVTYCA